MTAAPARFLPRNLSLAATCTQSAALAVAYVIFYQTVTVTFADADHSLHVSQRNANPGQPRFRPTSAVLLAEVVKLACSLACALLEARDEKEGLLKPMHALPSPALYAKAEDLLKTDLYSDPFDSPETIEYLEKSTSSPSTPSLRRRNSQHIAHHGLRLNFQIDRPDVFTPTLPERSLNSFTWPASPKPSTPKAREDEPPLYQHGDRAVRRRRKTIVCMLLEDVFTKEGWPITLPAVLYYAQSHLM